MDAIDRVRGEMRDRMDARLRGPQPLQRFTGRDGARRAEVLAGQYQEGDLVPIAPDVDAPAALALRVTGLGRSYEKAAHDVQYAYGRIDVEESARLLRDQVPEGMDAETLAERLRVTFHVTDDTARAVAEACIGGTGEQLSRKGGTDDGK